MGKKTNIVTNEMMIETLSSSLVEGETLQTPFYAICEEKGRQKHNGFCFIGTTESVLLFALLNIHATRVESTTRIPLKEIKKIEFRRSFFMKHIFIKITFYEGKDITIRASTKALLGGFTNQEFHLLNFIEKLRAFNQDGT